MPNFEPTPSPRVISSNPPPLSLFNHGCFGGRAQSEVQGAEAPGLQPAPRGAPRISTTNEERAVSLVAGRVYKKRSRATGWGCTSPLNAPRVSTGCRSITPVNADSGPAAGGALAASSDATAAQADDAVADRDGCLLPAARPSSDPPSLPLGDSYLHVFGEDREELQSSLVRNADAESCADRGTAAMRASIWAVGAPLELARRALSIGGQGHCMFSLGISRSLTANVQAEMRALAGSGLVTTISNSTSVRAIVAQGRSVDRGRGMVHLCDEAAAATGGAPGLMAMAAVFSGLSFLVSTLFDSTYGYHKPVSLVSSLRACQQTAHTDDRPPFVTADPPHLLGALMAVGPDTRQRLWPDSHRAVRGGSTTGGGPGVLFDVNPHNCLVLREDSVHCGVRNSSPLPHRRINVYLISAGHEPDVDFDATNPLPRWAGPRRARK